MFISVAQNNVNFKPIEVKNFKQLSAIICDQSNKAYSFSTYKDNYRNKKNFLKMRCIGLDIDNDKNGEQMSLESAKELFKDYKHIIATTRSHQKEKHGLVADRFRVILFFEREIEDEAEFTRTWHNLKKLFPAIDPLCKDTSRYWFPSKEIVQINKQGAWVEVPEYVEENKPKPEKWIDEDDSTRGKLSYNTMKFFFQGAEPGERNGKLFKAALDCREQGYDIEYVKTMVETMIKTTGNWGTDYLNQKDMEAITNAFSREVKYDKRIDESQGIPFNFIHISETLDNESIKTEWIVDGFLAKSGFSVFAGQPKSGKSTTIRQLAIAISRGEKFLDRDTEQLKVYYLSLEDQESQVKDQFNAQKVKKTDPIHCHYGPVTPNLEELENVLITDEVGFLIVDTMALFLAADDLNDYTTINKLLLGLRQVARNTGCHICMVHHQNKSKEGGTLSIMGSNAIHGAVDCAITFESAGKYRYLNTSRRGGKPFQDAKLEFNPKTQTYKIAKGKSKQYDDDDF